MKYLFLFIALLILTSCESHKGDFKYYQSQFQYFAYCFVITTREIDSYIGKDSVIEYNAKFDSLIKKKDYFKENAYKYLDSLRQLK